INESNDLTPGRSIIWKIDQLPDIKGDRTMIKLVFQNLLNNSIKFTRNNAEAVIEVGFEINDKKNITFFVKDNGAGFNNDDAGRLFGVFHRLHPDEEFEGTGIGLATVKRIVKRHGGMIWGEGKVDAGASFFFTLPG
ncbi:MAG: ATP-binding protein, partial [Bacteroidales bacterium]|nr:ATP-binding protein [Bacteroidales bacterium]